MPDVAPSRVGGDVAVDFFNTVDWRLDPERRHERLPTYLHLLAWMERTELLVAGDVEELSRQAHERPDLASAEHKLVLEMRDDTYDALNGGGYPDVLQRHLTSAHASSRLDRDPETPRERGYGGRPPLIWRRRAIGSRWSSRDC